MGIEPKEREGTVIIQFQRMVKILELLILSHHLSALHFILLFDFLPFFLYSCFFWLFFAGIFFKLFDFVIYLGRSMVVLFRFFNCFRLNIGGSI